MFEAEGVSGASAYSRISVLIGHFRPTWNEEENYWSFPKGTRPWMTTIRPLPGGGYEATPWGDLDEDGYYTYLITVSGRDASVPAAQHTGGFTADFGE